MKYIFVILAGTLALGPAWGDVKSARKEALQRINEESRELEDMRSCVTKAQTEEDVKICNIDLYPDEADLQKQEEQIESPRAKEIPGGGY